MTSKDPTRTLGIRKRWAAQFSKRFRKLNGRVNQLFKQQTGTPDAEFATFFNIWFTRELERLLFPLGQDPTNHWQNTYINQAFTRGQQAGAAQVLKELAIVNPVFSKLSDDALRLSHTKSFDDLKGIAEEVKAQVNRVLIAGIQAQDSKTAIRDAVKGRVLKIGLTRSRILASTRTPEVYNRAVITQAIELNDNNVKMLWITQGDERVRTTHALRNRKLYTTKAASGLVGEPNCRCSVRVFAGEQTAASRAAIRARQLRVSAAARKESRFFEPQPRQERLVGVTPFEDFT